VHPYFRAVANSKLRIANSETNASQSRGMEADRSRSEDQTDEGVRGRDVRLDADAEGKLVQASLRCKWRARTRELFCDIVALMRDTGMRNERELFQIRIENLDWNNRTILVPDSKTPEGRRLVPMSRRGVDILKKCCGTRTDGWVFPSKRSVSGHLRSICNLFRQARSEAGLPKELVLYCARNDPPDASPLRRHGSGRAAKSGRDRSERWRAVTLDSAHLSEDQALEWIAALVNEKLAEGPLAG